MCEIYFSIMPQCPVVIRIMAFYAVTLSQLHITSSSGVYLCVFCAFVFHTAYMLCYCQHSAVDLMGLKPGP